MVKNLISNSIKHTLKGYVSLKMDVVVERDVVRTIFRVKDTGMGIKKSKQPHIFQTPYFQTRSKDKYIGIYLYYILFFLFLFFYF